ncbi:MAG TPA: prenyltransferase/squalene oxidase repeat-containing protein [Solirubrobacterales bacterium]|nr:prenyltransferase/squalene oxidase repeat-containing protein [Solirubrobacterales bacterium]
MRGALRQAATAALLVVVAGLLAAGGAPAATVNLRIEGSQQALFEGPVSTQPREVDGNDGTGPHPCWGGLGAIPGPTPTTALADASRAAGFPWRGKWDPDFYDFFVESIGPDSSTPPEGYWGLWVNGTSAGGGCTTKVKEGDEVLWSYGSFKTLLLKLTGPTTAAVGEPFTVTVTAAGAPVANASVGGVLTDAAGHARITALAAARLKLVAERSDAVRSNALEVCVGVEAGCQEAGGGGAATLSIGKIEPGELFAKGAGPRVLRGEATGLARVALRLVRRVRGRCGSWDAGAAKLVGGPCAAPAEFPATVGGGAWAARIGRLRPGKYELRASGPGSAAATARVAFRVLPRRGTVASVLGRGLRYLRRAQHRDGGLGVSPRASSSAAMTGWATMVLGRGGPATAAAAGTAYLGRHLSGSDALGDQARSAFAVAAAGDDPALALTLCRRLAHRHGAGGSFDSDVDTTALAVLALAAEHCDAPSVNRAARWLRGRRNPDGGFGYRPGIPSDVDTTGLATWALAAVPRTHRAAAAGVAYLRGAQNPDGGFGSAPGSTSNSQSTGLAIAGLRATGLQPTRIRTEDGIDPVDYLATVQRGPGMIDYSRQGRQTPVWTTSQALLGLGRAPFLPGG